MSIEIDAQLLQVIQDIFGAHLNVELQNEITNAIQLRTLSRAIDTINCAQSTAEKALTLAQKAYDDPKVLRTRIKCACFPGQGATLTPEEEILLSELNVRQLRAALGSSPEEIKTEINCLLRLLKRIEDRLGQYLKTKPDDKVNNAKETCQSILRTLEGTYEAALNAIDLAEQAFDPHIFHARLKHAYGMLLSPEEEMRIGYFKEKK